MTEKKAEKSSKIWIFLAMLGGLFYSLGNVAFGISCSQLGVWGAGFVGPVTFVACAIYRVIEACRNKRRMGNFIDKEHSAYWRPRTDVSGDDFREANEMVQYKFNWHNLWIAAGTQAIPSLAGLILVAYAFKFALLA